MQSMTTCVILKIVACIATLALAGCSSDTENYIEVSADQLKKEGVAMDGRKLAVSGACVRMYQHGLALVSCETFGMSIALDFAPKFGPSEVGSISMEAHRFLMKNERPMPVEICGVYTHRESTQERWMVVDGIRVDSGGVPGIGSCPGRRTPYR